MCGISGFIDSTLKKDEAEKIISRMLESISHRGPDARDFWIEMPVALGHNRLSIIDLSKDGNQPMHFFDCTITYNGEIYNYIEVREQLRAEGYSFQTQSDTEVILAAYHAYGRECVNKFVGMWAFALWDKKKQELFCSRDRFGIKPFYYILDGGRFYFGSEYKALKQTPIFSNDLNLDQVSRGLQLGWVCYEDETYYSKLKALPAAHNLIYKNGKIEIERYWELNNTVNENVGFEEQKELLFELLSKSISIHMRSDVEIAICLSGGIDSSILTALVAKIYPEKTFSSYSIYYDGPNEVDERPFINEVINKYSSIKPKYLKPSNEEVLNRFHDIIDKVEIPATGSSNISHYYLIEKIHKDNIKVVIDGQGADEYFAGYMHSMYRYNADCIKSLSFGKLFSNIIRSSGYQNDNTKKLFESLGKSALSLFLNEMKLYSFEYKNYYPFVSKKGRNNIPFKLKTPNHYNCLNSFLYNLLFTSSLPTILHYVDRMTMAHSVESRVPFLDHRLIEFAFTLKNDLKISKGVTKYLLRESFKDILPEKIYNRRDKKGFVTPGEINWLRGPMKNLLDIDYNRLDFLEKEKVKNIIDGYKKGENKNSKLVWRLATLNYWIKNFN